MVGLGTGMTVISLGLSAMLGCETGEIKYDVGNYLVTNLVTKLFFSHT